MTLHRDAVLARRQAIGRIGGALGAGLGALVLAGCASRRPAEPPLPKPPVRQLAVLPVTHAYDSPGTGFGYAPPVVVPVVINPGGRRMSTGNTVAAAVGVGLVVGLVGYAVESHRQSERKALLEALSQVNFNAAGFLDAGLAAALAERRVPMHAITDPAVGYAVRARQFEALPPEVDAYLDVTVRDSGNYSSMRAGGYSPVLQVDARVVPVQPLPDGDDLDSFGYYADWRNGGKDPRWLTTPKSLTMATLDDLRAQAATVRAGLEALTGELAVKIADDVQRVVRAHPRVD